MEFAGVPGSFARANDFDETQVVDVELLETPPHAKPDDSECGRKPDASELRDSFQNRKRKDEASMMEMLPSSPPREPREPYNPYTPDTPHPDARASADPFTPDGKVPLDRFSPSLC